MANKSVGKVKVTQVKSAVKRVQKQQDTLRGLGLKKMNSSKVLAATPEVLGMINCVKHLVTVEKVA